MTMATLAELEDRVRFILDDRVNPHRFQSSDIRSFLNDATQEAAIRTRVIQDTTSPLASLALLPNTSTYTLDPCIFAVRRARVDGCRECLELLDARELDRRIPGWDDASLHQPGTPRFVVFDFGTRQLRLFPVPAVAASLTLLLWRVPAELEIMEADEDEPAIPPAMHRELAHYAAAHCLLNPDSDANGPNSAAAQMALFDAAFGRKPDHHEIRLWSTNRRTRMQACWE